jgi:hypothetical protein
MNNIELTRMIFLILIAISHICVLQNIKVKKKKTHYKFLKYSKKDLAWVKVCRL